MALHWDPTRSHRVNCDPVGREFHRRTADIPNLPSLSSDVSGKRATAAVKNLASHVNDATKLAHFHLGHHCTSQIMRAHYKSSIHGFKICIRVGIDRFFMLDRSRIQYDSVNLAPLVSDTRH